MPFSCSLLCRHDHSCRSVTTSCRFEIENTCLRDKILVWNSSSIRFLMSRPSYRNFSIPVRGRSGGFSLLEALIGIVVVGLGFIGMAGLQLSALKDTQTSRNVSTATILARDMADRVRISGVAVAAFDFSGAAPTTTVNCVGTTNVCSGANFFSTQYANWISLVQTQLVGGNGIVCRDSTPNDGTPAAPNCSNAAADPLVVKVWWTEKDRSVGTQERYVMPLFARRSAT